MIGEYHPKMGTVYKYKEPESGQTHGIQMNNWVWKGDEIIIENREWFNNNYVEIKEWFTERMLLTHLSFEGTSRIIVRDITPEIKTMFTLQFK